ncbi:unnamed protein product [Mytilus edulis]|uniref:Uncharacterized protein n=1 Tax=Mytilus edulis TaxID=6550 RepID=A0A8S3S0Z2_MYTED|nr:unnamed protein product [Mytilus edulis]
MDYNNRSQSNFMNGNSNNRKKEQNNSSKSTFMHGNSTDRMKEYNNPSTVMNGSPNKEQKEHTNPSQSTVMNGSSTYRKNEYNDPSQSIVINGSSNDRKNEYNDPSQSIVINGSSNDRKKELNNPSQSTAMHRSLNDRNKEYQNLSQSTDFSDKGSSQQNNGNETAVVHNHNMKQDNKNNSDKHGERESNGHIKKQRNSKISNQLNQEDMDNKAIHTEKTNELTGVSMSEKNKITVMRHKTNKHNIQKQSTSNDNTSEGHSEESGDRSVGTNNNNKNNVDDKQVQIFEKDGEYQNKQIQIRDQNISNSRKPYKEDQRELTMNRKHDDARVDNAEVLFEDEDTCYTSRTPGVHAIDRFRDHETEKITQKKYTSTSVDIEKKQIGSSTNKMKNNKPIPDVNEGKKFDENVAKSTIKENENNQQSASRSKSKYTDSSDRHIHNVSRETSKNIHNQNTTDDKNDHYETYVTPSKAKEQYKTDDSKKSNTEHLGVVVNGKNQTNHRKHQLTKATESDITKFVDVDNRTFHDPSSNSKVKKLEMSKSDKKDSIHSSNVTETYQTANMESKPKPVRVTYDNKTTKGQKGTTFIEIDNSQTNNSKSIDSCQTNTGYPVNNTSSPMVLSKSVNTSTNRESGISNKTESSEANTPKSLDQNNFPGNNKYNDMQSKSPLNSQVADLTGDNKEKLKLNNDKSMSKTEIGEDKNSTKGISYISQNNARAVNDNFSVGDLQDNNIMRKHKLSGTTSNSVDIKQQKSIFQHHRLNKDDHTNLTMLPLKKPKELYHSSEMSPDVATVNNTRERITESNTQNDSVLGLKSGLTDGNEKYKGNDQQNISFLQGTLAEKSSKEMSANKLAYSKYHVNNPQSSRFITANSSDKSSDLINVSNIQQSKFKGQGPGNDSFLSSGLTEQTFNRREENIIRKKDYTVAQIEDTVKASNSARNVSGSCPYDIPVLYSANDNTTYSTNNAKPTTIKTVHALEKSTTKRRSIYDALHGDNNHFY